MKQFLSLYEKFLMSDRFLQLFNGIKYLPFGSLIQYQITFGSADCGTPSIHLAGEWELFLDTSVPN